MLGFFINLFKKRVRLDTNLLPSQGLFYKEDFTITISPANTMDILEYERNYKNDNLAIVIHLIKNIVRKNVKLNKDYVFNDIKSIDIIFIFLEIVRITRGRPINLVYIDNNKEYKIEFCPIYFNYFSIGGLWNYYNKEERCFNILGYKYTLPSIGVETSLTNFFISKSDEEYSQVYSEYSYIFTHFLGDKNKLDFSEIENLIEIFNFDIEKEEFGKIVDIVETFLPIQTYSLKKDDTIIELNSKIDLGNIWK